MLELIQCLLQLLPCNYIHGHGFYYPFFDSLLDIVSWMMDELPKGQNKALLSWCRSNATLFTTSNRIGARIHKILPFAIQSSYLASLVFRKEERTVNVFDEHFNPWEWIENVVPASDHKLSWNDPQTAELLNDAPLSLAHFGTKVIKPMTSLYPDLIQQGVFCPPVPDEPAQPLFEPQIATPGRKRKSMD